MSDYRKCQSCGTVKHQFFFPWADPDGDLSEPRTRMIKAEPAATYAKRVANAEIARDARSRAVMHRRRAAQAKGRNFAACLSCRHGDANN